MTLSGVSVKTIIGGIYINIRIHSLHSAIGLVRCSSIHFHMHHGGRGGSI